VVHEGEHAAAAREASHPTPPAPLLPVKSAAPNVIGQWSGVINPGTSVVGVHAILMKTGKVLMYSVVSVLNGAGGSEFQSVAQVWDPITRKGRRVDPPLDHQVFCGGATILGDGTVLVVGGLDQYHGRSSDGTRVVLLFDPISETWSIAPLMRQGRWYPSLVELTNGAGLLVGGRNETGGRNTDLETVGPLPSVAPKLVGQYPLNAVEDLYPNVFLLPDGRLFSFAGDRTDFLDPSTWRINNGPVTLTPQFDYPNATILPLKPNGDFVVDVWGGKNAFAGIVKSVSVQVDLSSPTPRFKPLPSMPQPRTDMNSVLLPDETIAVIGGNGAGNVDVPYYQALLYDPTHDVWTPGPSQAKRRAYHSTALLLPDATVLSAGDNNAGGGQAMLEVYSPPYLFKGPRPQILGVSPTGVSGEWIGMVTDVPVAKLVLVAPGAVTHATNMHQRLVELPIITAGITTVAQIPSIQTVPPGAYMVFALNDAGVPSVASWVQIN
jgi:hypothetical protein